MNLVKGTSSAVHYALTPDDLVDYTLFRTWLEIRKFMCLFLIQWYLIITIKTAISVA